MKSVLIANRGEIAWRIIRACNKLSLRSIAVYSDLDRRLPHLNEATESVRLGETRAYLDIEKIVQAAIEHRADAIHPGYGFLSENPELAQRCEEEEIIFVGPSKQALGLFGDKDQTRSLALENSVPIIKGLSSAQLEHEPELLDSLSWPLMIKAAHGGGGKGMRLVKNSKDFSEAFAAAKRESINSFDSAELIVEEAILDARHIEVQIVSDGTETIHLFDRDCSIQRRHQKIVESAPAADLPLELRQRLFSDSIKLVKKAKMSGLATVEFLVQESSKKHFLLEVNPRLQVEHPVTEMVCGLDLVCLHLKIAAGEPLKLKQNTIKPLGIAIEARICAENPYQDFLPQTGRISEFYFPTAVSCETEQIRVDHSLTKDLRVSASYDSLLAKLICKSSDFSKTAELLNKSLKNTYISGLQTNIPFLLDASKYLARNSQKLGTSDLDRITNSNNQATLLEITKLAAATSLASEVFSRNFSGKAGLFSINSNESSKISLSVKGPEGLIDLTCRVTGKSDFEQPLTSLTVWIDESEYQIKPLALSLYDGSLVRVRIDNKILDLIISPPPSFDDISEINILQTHFEIRPKKQSGKNKVGLLNENIVSPIPGIILSLKTKLEDSVEEGETLVTLESMKMEHSITATHPAKVVNILVKEGQSVEAGDLLIELKATTKEAK